MAQIDRPSIHHSPATTTARLIDRRGSRLPRRWALADGGGRACAPSNQSPQSSAAQGAWRLGRLRARPSGGPWPTELPPPPARVRGPPQVPSAGRGAQPFRVRGAAGFRDLAVPSRGQGTPPPLPRRSLEPLGSPVTSPPDYALTRLQPHFLGGGDVRAGEGGASVGGAPQRREHPGPPSPALTSPTTHPGQTQPGPLPPRARPPPGAAALALCSQRAQVAGRLAGRGRARAEGGRGWSRPGPAPAPPPALPPPPGNCVPSCPVPSPARPVPRACSGSLPQPRPAPWPDRGRPAGPVCSRCCSWWWPCALCPAPTGRAPSARWSGGRRRRTWCSRAPWRRSSTWTRFSTRTRARWASIGIPGIPNPTLNPPGNLGLGASSRDPGL